VSGGKLGELQTRAARLVAAPGIDRGTLAVKIRELITAAHELGREERERELAVMSSDKRAGVLSRTRHPSALALSDDDSEPEADAAEQRAQFTGGPDIGPEVLADYLSGRASQPGWPVETGEPFRGAAEREWDDSRGGEP
jgi:hypothetical protein